MSWHPKSRFLDVRGQRMHVVDVGEGPTILLMHGFLHSSYTWRANLEPLAKRYRVVAPDLLGHGWSERGPLDYSLSGFTDQVEALLAKLGIDRVAAAVGNSLGGGVALNLALRKGPLVKIRWIHVSGNNKTRDYVVRREMRFLEGDLFNQKKLDDSKRLIRRLGFFDAVDIRPVKVGDDEADIHVKVEEGPAGTLS